MVLSNKVYDAAKWVAIILLPAAATLYFAISKIWNLPYGPEIVATITAVNVFLGAILQVSSGVYRASLKK